MKILTSLIAIKKLKEEISFSISDHLVAIATGDGLKAEEKRYSLLFQKPMLLQKAKYIASAKRKRIKAEANAEAVITVIKSFTQLKLQYVNV